ncbi:MAG: ABC-F family ATP-binding cassette domain-containing protein [Holosporales bacterium]
MLKVEDLAVTFGDRLLFESVNLDLVPGNRYGLVGGNGVGKSTFMRVLGGEEEASMGEVNFNKGLRLGWLKQDHFLYENDTIVNAVIRGNGDLWEAMVRKQQLIDNEDWSEENIMLLGDLEEAILQHDGYSAESRAHELLMGLGFPEEIHHQPMSSLSGGFKLRVLLAQALFNNPDILLLDEPTNHLDILNIAWLEDYLKKYRGVLVFISHDEGFLNNLSTHILDIDYGEIRLYHGNYDAFLQQKQLVMEQKEQQRKNVEARIEHLQKFVDRFKAKASKARQAQSKQKMIDRIELPDVEHTSRRSPNIDFRFSQPSGKMVLKIVGLTKDYGEKRVLNNVSATINRGEKVVFIGRNGIGKSTLLKCALGLVEAESEEITWGHGVKTAYFAQDHHEVIADSRPIFNWLEDQCADQAHTMIRSVLGRMLFSGDDAFKMTTALSGGEMARLLLGRMMLAHANVLILDEPTNHLDIEAIDALTKALRDYQGTVLFVSHDRRFVERLATRVIALSDKSMKDHKGSYQEYIAKFGLDYLSKSWLEADRKHQDKGAKK